MLVQRAAPPAMPARIFGIYDQLAGVAIALGCWSPVRWPGGSAPVAATVLTAATCPLLTSAAGRRLPALS